MGWIGCVRCEKCRCDFVAQTFALIAPIHPILHRVSCSYERMPNAPKHYETHQNMSFGSNGVDQVRLLGKITTWLHGTNFCVNWTSPVCFTTSFMQLHNIPNAPKYYKTDRNISLGSNGVDWLHSLQTISTGHCDTNICINCSSSSSFAQSFMQLRNDPKCTQTLRNTPKHEFRTNGVD